LELDHAIVQVSGGDDGALPTIEQQLLFRLVTPAMLLVTLSAEFIGRN
jgi:hypothetical protein